jgi:hypothetical protein
VELEVAQRELEDVSKKAGITAHYPSWPSPRSHGSATGPRNQQTTFRAKTHQHAQRKLARLAACAASVRPMACVGQTGDTGQTGGQSRSDRWTEPVRPVDRAGQAGGYNSRTKCSREPQQLL